MASPIRRTKEPFSVPTDRGGVYGEDRMAGTMANWDERDERRLNDLLMRILTADTVEALAGILVEATPQVIDCDHIAYNDMDEVNLRMNIVSSDEDLDRYWQKNHEVLDEFIYVQHPVVQYFAANPYGPPTTISDRSELSDFYETDLHRGYFKHLDMKDQMAIFVGGHVGGYAALAMNRSNASFNERDRIAASRIQDGFRRVYESLWLRDTLSAIVDARDLDKQHRIYRALGLTQRQSEVCVWLLVGKPISEIAEILGMSAETAKRHAAAIYQRLGISGRNGLQRTILSKLLERSG